ncbi:uncharacterized protein F5891DRAFT_984855 [Suillus fuscotomentosus]|uniref:Uncharacterized protein n=1 Tax=Suillus fuscotomentosus TaxID=1912939 RepID=A0AAD4DVE0_9AGAM|nr:uncharacterized protein F5891DRAFT_984855 [Suillus fuscotomentosus]KAG1894699.1 hypothetical protein F5891DRAFT_984855 [Suillus fuscotomentosus]
MSPERATISCKSRPSAFCRGHVGNGRSMLSFNTEQRDLSVTLIDPHADQTGQIPHFLILSSLAVDDRYTVDAEDAKQWSRQANHSRNSLNASSNRIPATQNVELQDASPNQNIEVSYQAPRTHHIRTLSPMTSISPQLKNPVAASTKAHPEDMIPPQRHHRLIYPHLTPSCNVSRIPDRRIIQQKLLRGENEGATTRPCICITTSDGSLSDDETFVQICLPDIDSYSSCAPRRPDHAMKAILTEEAEGWGAHYGISWMPFATSSSLVYLIRDDGNLDVCRKIHARARTFASNSIPLRSLPLPMYPGTLPGCDDVNPGGKPNATGQKTLAGSWTTSMMFRAAGDDVLLLLGSMGVSNIMPHHFCLSEILRELSDTDKDLCSDIVTARKAAMVQTAGQTQSIQEIILSTYFHSAKLLGINTGFRAQERSPSQQTEKYNFKSKSSPKQLVWDSLDGSRYRYQNCVGVDILMRFACPMAVDDSDPDIAARIK